MLHSPGWLVQRTKYSAGSLLAAVPSFLQAKQIVKELVCVVSVAIEAQTFPYDGGLLQHSYVGSGCRHLRAVARLRERFVIPLRGCVKENKVLQFMTCASAQPLQEGTLKLQAGDSLPSCRSRQRSAVVRDGTEQ